MGERTRETPRRTELAQRRLTAATSATARATALAVARATALAAAVTAGVIAGIHATPSRCAAETSLDPTAGTFFRPAVNVSHTGNASSLPRSSPRSLALDPHGPALLFWVEAVPHSRGIASELALARFIPVAGWDTTFTPVGRWEGDPSTEPACALDPGRTLHLVWLQQRGGERIIEGLHFRLATGEMSEIETISDPALHAADPAVGADGAGHAHVAWSELAEGRSRIAYREWSPAAGWGPMLRLPSVSGEGAFGPDVAASERGRVHLVWQESTPGGSRVAWASRPAGGAFEPAQFLSADQPRWYVADPLVAQSPLGEAAFAVWQATNGTVSRILSGALPGDPAAGEPGAPVTVVEGVRLTHPSAALDSEGNLHFLWIADSPAGQAVMYDRRSPGGTPGSARPLTLPGGGPFESPILAADAAGRVVAVWIDRSLGQGDVLARSGLASLGAPLGAVRHLAPAQ
jgi:hypothetical protein